MRVLRAAGATMVLLALIIGIPCGLWFLGSALLPSVLPTWDQIRLLLTSPLSGNFLVGALIIVGWIGWATFAVAVLVELAAMLRGRRPPRLPALGPQQRLAAVLLAAILLGLGGTAPSSSADSTSPAEPTTVSSAVRSEVSRDTPGPQSPTAPRGPEAPTASAVITVAPGDTLWDLAVTHLGDGHRWTEIADLNYGIPQPDGGSLTDSHWIEAGWQLQLPVPEQTAPAQATDTQVTVEAGDTLYDLAAEHLGDGERYPDLVQATRGLVQPGGGYLTDPDEIYPGWQVVIPQTGAAPPAAEGEEPGTEVDSDAGDGRPGTEPTPEPVPLPHNGQPTQDDAPAPEQSAPATAPPVADQTQTDSAIDTDESGSEEAWAPSALQTAGGLGALLAAAVAATLLARRRRVVRSSPPGVRVALPPPGSQSAEFERELRAVADPIGRAAINVALRDLAVQAESAGESVPAIVFVRYAGDGTELQVYLDEPADLPPPWAGSTDRRIWSVTDDDLAAQVMHRTDAGDIAATYPALVGLGLGDQDTHLLVDLERLGHLDLRGDRDRARGVLAALMLELITSDWADDLQVTVVGDHADLAAALESPRVLHLATAQQALHRIAPHQQAPQLAASLTRWPPEVIFFAVALSDDEREQLQQRLTAAEPGMAVVTIGTNLGAAAIELRPGTLDATLLPSQMPIQVQHLDQAEYREIADVLDVHLVPGPEWTSTLAQAREATVQSLLEPDPVGDLPVVEEPDALFEIEHTSPQVRLLGPVELVGADTSVLSSTVSHLHAAVEMTAYLCLHEGATVEKLTAALWPNQAPKPSTRHSLVSRTRRLLGTTPQGAARLEGHTSGGTDTTTYHLTDVGNDWADFAVLHGPDPSLTPLPDLRRALMLVRGAPFSQVRDGAGRVRANRYLWSDALAMEMVASIVDVACETARRALLEGKPRLAAEAADAGLRATSDHERLWRAAITARLQMGEHAAAAELTTALTERLTELDVDPEPETNTLLDHVASRTGQAAG